ncbi:hypothetical protein GGX14DRAFT_405666 [Mycena pura]|uniref:Uncharacterized protein n=1 Tax=Mycena pura TaxID=153505 RepID=A0AAD6UYP7_9AGAR|nr:hypothetical protein GGX14DRAFT_405666 [Mycena pura]
MLALPAATALDFFFFCVSGFLFFYSMDRTHTCARSEALYSAALRRALCGSGVHSAVACTCMSYPALVMVLHPGCLAPGFDDGEKRCLKCLYRGLFGCAPPVSGARTRVCLMLTPCTRRWNTDTPLGGARCTLHRGVRVRVTAHLAAVCGESGSPLIMVVHASRTQRLHLANNSVWMGVTTLLVTCRIAPACDADGRTIIVHPVEFQCIIELRNESRAVNSRVHLVHTYYLCDKPSRRSGLTSKFPLVKAYHVTGFAARRPYRFIHFLDWPVGSGPWNIPRKVPTGIWAIWWCLGHPNRAVFAYYVEVLNPALSIRNRNRIWHTHTTIYGAYGYLPHNRNRKPLLGHWLQAHEELYCSMGSSLRFHISHLLRRGLSIWLFVPFRVEASRSGTGSTGQTDPPELRT